MAKSEKALLQAALAGIPRYFPGEQEAIAQVVAYAERYGYGNLIMRLKDAWSEKVQRTEGFSKEMADRHALHICPWCQVDGRTGKKAKKLPPPLSAGKDEPK